MPPTVPPVSRVLFRFISGTSGSGSVCAYASTNVAIDMPPVVTGSMLGGYRRGISPTSPPYHAPQVRSSPCPTGILHHQSTAVFYRRPPCGICLLNSKGDAYPHAFCRPSCRGSNHFFVGNPALTRRATELSPLAGLSIRPQPPLSTHRRCILHHGASRSSPSAGGY